MISIDEALRHVISAAGPLAPIKVPLAESLSLVLAEDVKSDVDSPPFDRSTVDHPMRAIRTDSHKLVWHVGGAVELYDLVADPGELTDVAAAQPDVRDRLMAELQDWESSLEKLTLGPDELEDIEEELARLHD